MNEAQNCHSERSEESASQTCAEKKQIPRATAPLGMTPFGLFPGLAQFPLIFFQSLLLFLCVLCAPVSVSSVLSFSLLSSPESEKPEWCRPLPRPEYSRAQAVRAGQGTVKPGGEGKALHTFGGFSFLLAAARKE